MYNQVSMNLYILQDSNNIINLYSLQFMGYINLLLDLMCIQINNQYIYQQNLSRMQHMEIYIQVYIKNQKINKILGHKLYIHEHNSLRNNLNIGYNYLKFPHKNLSHIIYIILGYYQDRLYIYLYTANIFLINFQNIHSYIQNIYLHSNKSNKNYHKYC